MATDTFNSSEDISACQVCEQNILVLARNQYCPGTVDRNTAASIYWLYDSMWLESRLDLGFVCHDSDCRCYWLISIA